MEGETSVTQKSPETVGSIIEVFILWPFFLMLWSHDIETRTWGMEARFKRKRHIIHRNTRGATRHKVQTRIWRGREQGGHFSFAGHPLYQRAREGTVRPGSKDVNFQPVQSGP